MPEGPVAGAASDRDRARSGRAVRPGASLWRSSTAGALLAIALLVAATVAAAIWLSILDQQRQAQEQLTRQAHAAALQIRARLIETEQLLLLEGSGYTRSTERFRRDMDELLAANPALLRVELRGRDGTLLGGADAQPPRPTLPATTRLTLSPDASAAFDTASRLNRLTYSRPYFITVGPTGFDLMEMIVPTGAIDGPMLVAVYAPQRILDHFLPGDLGGDHLFSLVESDGTMAARQAAIGQTRSERFAISPLARTGTTLQVRADALQARPRLIPNVLTGLVAATTVGLGLAMFFLVRDVRQRAQVERALREQVQFRRSVEDSIHHGLIVFDLDERVAHVNDALVRILGFSREELIGLVRPLPFAPPVAVRDRRAYTERLAALPEAEAAIERSRGFHTTFRAKDGSQVEALVVEAPLYGAQGQRLGTITLAADITEQRRVEELARRQQEVLQSRSRLATLGEMASTLSHELNQPLAAITSYAAACENLVRAQPPRPEQVAQALLGIRTQAERAGQVIRSVQAFLRRRAIDRNEVDLAVLVRGLEPLLNIQAMRTGARILIDVPAELRVFADRIMLEQVLLNLTRNGFDAMADTPLVERVLELRARSRTDDERGQRVEVAVIDHGRGVPPEVAPQLFNAFFTTKADGMGLGLSLCRSVIEQHGGHLQYRPRPEGGSTFAFDLPCRDEAVRAHPVPTTASGAER
jgi:two-component system sensor histidine kinase DctS